MPEHIDSSDFPAPDWEFGTDDDLRTHAACLVSVYADALVELDQCPDRPAGEVAHASIDIPCPDDITLTRYALYVGFCADACRDNGLVVRNFGTDQTDQGPVVRVIICTANGLAVAQVEDGGDDHPERSIRTH